MVVKPQLNDVMYNSTFIKNPLHRKRKYIILTAKKAP